MPFTITVNGEPRTVDVPGDIPLLWVIREVLDLPGTKYGCGMSLCGACTVHVNGAATRSCVTPISEVAGKQITTIESLEKDGQLHPLQQAFLDAEALQCGYCTAGMIMSGVALLAKNTNPTSADVVRSMEGNMCRCGTYSRIVLAVQKAAATMKGGAR